MSKTFEVKLKPILKSINLLRLSALIATTVGLSSQTGITNAYNLDSFMSNMYVNTSGAGYFSAQQRGVISGGSIVARVPIKPINVASFDPPRVSAGCGGINLFGGSFSFINAKELTALLRTIAQNALGLLFQLGINAISQPLSAMLTTWSKKLQDMNSTLRNSCEAARKLFSLDLSGASISESFKSAKEVVSTGFGGFSDYFSGISQRWKDGWQSLKDGDSAPSYDKALKDEPNQGNVGYRALTESQAYKNISMNSTEQSDYEAKLLLLNLTGTEVYDPTDNANEGCKGSSGQCEPKVKRFDPVLEFSDLITPASGKDKFFYCEQGSNFQINDPNGCNKMKFGPLNSFYNGIRSTINNALYAQNTTLILPADQIVQFIVDGKGLVGKANIANPTLTAAESRFMANDPLSSVTYLSALSGNPTMAATLSEKIRIITERRQAIQLGDALYTAALGAYNGGNVTSAKPANFDANLQKFKQELDAYRQVPALEMQDPIYLDTYSKMLLSSMESAGISVPLNVAR